MKIGSGKRPNGNYLGIPGNYAPTNNNECWMCGKKVGFGKGFFKTHKSLQSHMSNPPLSCLRIWKARKEMAKRQGKHMPRLD